MVGDILHIRDRNGIGIFELKNINLDWAHVAQLVEHSLGKGEVTGSNPVAGSIKFNR